MPDYCNNILKSQLNMSYNRQNITHSKTNTLKNNEGYKNKFEFK